MVLKLIAAIDDRPGVVYESHLEWKVDFDTNHPFFGNTLSRNECLVFKMLGLPQSRRKTTIAD